MPDVDIWFGSGHDNGRSARPIRVAVVGNAPQAGDHGPAIDACDTVVRFNNGAGFGAWSGRRATHLVLVNHGGQMGEWLGDARFTQRPAVAAAPRIVFPLPPRPDNRGVGRDGHCWSAPARARLEAAGKQVVHLPRSLKREAQQALGVPAEGPGGDPSTGLLAVFSLLRAARRRPLALTLFGFGFSGWPGHPWAAERAFVEEQARAGRLELAPLRTGTR